MRLGSGRFHGWDCFVNEPLIRAIVKAEKKVFELHLRKLLPED